MGFRKDELKVEFPERWQEMLRQWLETPPPTQAKQFGKSRNRRRGVEAYLETDYDSLLEKGWSIW